MFRSSLAFLLLLRRRGERLPRSSALAKAALAVVGVVALIVAFPAPAAAEYQEARTLSDDVRFRIGADGVASVVHEVRYIVTAGRFKAFDIAGVDADVALPEQISVVAEDGRSLQGHVTRHPKLRDAARVSFDEPRGLGRGTYAFVLPYVLDLVATKALERTDEAFRLSYVMAAHSEGRDAVRVIFDVPAAPASPTLAVPEDAPTTLASLRRLGDRDELELVRAHVSRGESVIWRADLDPRAFPELASGGESVTLPAEDSSGDGVTRTLMLAAGAVALGLLACLAMLAYRAKRRNVEAACAKRGLRARPVLPVSPELGGTAYGVLVAAATASLLWGNALVGAVLVAGASGLATHLGPRRSEGLRGPGRWRTISSTTLSSWPRVEDDRDVFFLRSVSGARTFLAFVCAVILVAVAASHRWPGAWMAVVLAASSALPLFLTGTRGAMPKSVAELAATRLVPVGREVRKGALGKTRRLALVARYDRPSSFDEVRLTCSVADPLPGLRTIELALAPPAGGDTSPAYEVFVRFDDDSEAAAKIAGLAKGLPIVVGRSTDERVLRIVPRVEAPRDVARLLVHWLGELVERRANSASTTQVPGASEERRGRPLGSARQPSGPVGVFSTALGPAAATPR